MALRNYIDTELKKDSVRKHFKDPKLLEEALNDMDKIIGMHRAKAQMVDSLKTHVTQRVLKEVPKNCRRHCLITGSPGLGKSKLARVLCRIWTAMGYISGNKNTQNIKVNSFPRLQDEIIRRQNKELQDFKNRLKACKEYLKHTNKASSICKSSIKNLIDQRQKIPPSFYSTLYSDLNICSTILTGIDTSITLLTNTKDKFSGIKVDPNMREIDNNNVGTNFHIFTKSDVVSRYVGDTVHRATEAMEKAIGGVAFFDEAYNLCQDSGGMDDSYGRDALTVINRYMDERADDLIVIFAGYKKEIEQNLFTAQQGLESRFTQSFNLEPYDAEELSRIFVLEVKNMLWDIDYSEELKDIIQESYNDFTSYGRDMNTLASYTIKVKSRLIYEDLENIEKGKKVDKKISNLNIVREGLEIFKQNKVKKTRNNRMSLEELLRSNLT